MSSDSLIPLDDRERWDDALAVVPHGFHHTWEFAKANSLTTGYDTFLYELSDSDGLSICALVERPVDAYVDMATVSGLSGFAGDLGWRAIEPRWAALAEERGYVTGYIGLNPLFEPSDVAGEAASHNDIYTLDLRAGPDALRAASDRSRRRELRGWDERAQKLVTDREPIAAFLLEHYEPFMKTVGARPPYLTPEGLELLCESERCLLVGAAPDGDLEAVYVFGATPHCVDCFLAVSIGDGRRHLTDLLWYGVTQFAARSVPLMNLGGGTKRNDVIARAKQRFHPERHELRALRQIYADDTYAALCKTATAPAPEGWFPAYRSPA